MNRLISASFPISLMPCLSGNFDARSGLIVPVGIAPSDLIGATPAQQFLALIDTGASGTCISPAVAASVGLQPTGKRMMTSATHRVSVNSYLADLAIPFGAPDLSRAGGAVPAATYRRMLMMEFSSLGGGRYQVLLGRDIICRGALALSFDGHFTFCL